VAFIRVCIVWLSAVGLGILPPVCGRYSDARARRYLIRSRLPRCEIDLFFAPRYNIAPTQKASVLTVENGLLTEKRMVWGFLPKWAKAPIINAQQETIATKPTFKDAAKSQRCLIPADGFYEWKSEGGRKVPMRFVLGEEEQFYFAGIWERFVTKPVQTEGDLFNPPQTTEASEFDAFLILTTAANSAVQPVHTRMPVIVTEELCDGWLDPSCPLEAVSHVFEAPDNARLRFFPINPLVNNVRNDSPECLRPA
jgi:putative SOS response-associated peptidase YedK